MALLAMAGLTSLTAPVRVAADCDGPMPEFDKVVRTAQTIVIGEVVAVHPGGAWDPAFGGIASRFTLKIEHLIRGAADEIVEVKDLPSQPCSSVIGARLGDRIALAVNGTAFTPPVQANMIAWIDGPPPPDFGGGDPAGPRSYSVEQVYALAGSEPPPASADPSPATSLDGVAAATSSDPPILLGVGVALMLVVLVLGVVILRTRRQPTD